MKNMKVLMIGPYPPPYGGIAIVIRDLLDSPLNKKFIVRLLRTEPKGSNEILRFLKDIVNLIKKMINFKPNIVHIHTSYDWGWPKNITYALIAKFFRKKVILHIHAYDKRCKNSFPRIWLKRYIYPPSIGLRIADYIFTLSDTYSNNIRTIFNDVNVKTIKNGVLKSRFDSFTTKKDDHLVITNISLNKRKGIIELMEVIPKLIDRYSNVEFNMIGTGDYVDEVNKWYSKLDDSIRKNVILTGVLSENEKIGVLKKSDIFVLQSENEGLPITILEAMISGCAIITSPVGQITDVISDGVNGFLIPPKDSNQLYRTLINLIENKELLNKMKENNREQREKYSWEEISKEIEGIYTVLIEE